VCAIVDACLKRERDERTSNAGVLANQMEAALREMRAVRFRALGRRAADRGGGEMQRRATDFAENTVAAPIPAGQKQPSSSISQRNLVLLAAGVGVAIGALALGLVMAILRMR
jgi:serine/threonine-protein kinase